MILIGSPSHEHSASAQTHDSWPTLMQWVQHAPLVIGHCTGHTGRSAGWSENLPSNEPKVIINHLLICQIMSTTPFTQKQVLVLMNKVCFSEQL